MSLSCDFLSISQPGSQMSTPDVTDRPTIGAAGGQDPFELDVPVIYGRGFMKQLKTIVMKLDNFTLPDDVIEKTVREFKASNQQQNDSLSCNGPSVLTEDIAPSSRRLTKVELKDYELHCVYFAAAGHCFEELPLTEYKVSVLDQIFPVIKPYTPSRFNTIDDGADTLQSKPSSSSLNSFSSAPGQHKNVFILCVNRKGDKMPRLGDGRVMNTLVQQYSPSALSLPSSDQSDLCALPDLNERTLLYHIKGRFEKKKFYTYVGTILISVNPYWMVGSLYGVETMQKYQLQSSTTGTLSRGLEPHVFAVGDQAFVGMRESKQDQCIVISGESGSGKTVAANDIIRYLMQLANQGDPTMLELMIAHTSPILEAFGNAKTDHNDNSSRHGKYIQIQYKAGGIVNGARVQKYLLEKSRIIQHKKNERNYHVFFYLLASDYTDEDEVCKSQFSWLKEMLSLTKASDYHYLNQSELSSNEQEDLESFLYLVQSMHELLGASGMRYSEKQQKQGLLSSTIVNVFTILAAILHLGNVQFALPASENLEKDLVQIINEEHLKLFCELMKLPLDKVKLTLQTRKHEGAAQFVKHNSIRDAENARDTVAKSLYSSLFDWIIRQINFRMFSASMNESSYYQSIYSTGEERQIGILDIFGFEDIGLKNSFEQFCINFANEQLQFYFNDNIFCLEQQEYKNDGINWMDIDYVNNKPCIDLFVKRPFCLFALIDEESSLYNGTNEKLLDKFEQLGNSKLAQSKYFKWRPVKQDPLSFGIKHYAGDVRYNISEFREKNMEKTNDLMRLMRCHTSSFFVKELCCYSPVGIAGWRTVRNVISAAAAFSQISRGKLKVISANSADDGKMRGRSKSIGSAKLLLMHQTNSRSDSVEMEASPLLTQHSRENWTSPGFDPRMAKAVSTAMSHRKANRLRRIRDQPLFKVAWFYNQDPERLNNRKISKNSSLLSSSSLELRKKDSTSAESERWLTISSQFTGSLNQLMESLNRCKPSFIRCIRSNTKKVSLEFDEKTVTRQLKYTGMLDTIRIRSSGYNVRMLFDDFVQEYRILLPHGRNSNRQDVEKLLSDIFPDPKSFQLGNSKVYLREKGHMQLQFFIELKLSIKVQMIQRWWRQILPAVLDKRQQKAAATIQRSFNKYKHTMKERETEKMNQLCLDFNGESGDKSRPLRSCTFSSPEDEEPGKRGSTRSSDERKPIKHKETKDKRKSADDSKTQKAPKRTLHLPNWSTKSWFSGSSEALDSESGRSKKNVNFSRENRPKPIRHHSPAKPSPEPHVTPTRNTIAASSPAASRLLSSPSYQMCQKCHTKTPVAPDGGDVTIITCTKCSSPAVAKGKQVGVTPSQSEFETICKTVLPADKLYKVLLKDTKEVNRFTQFLNTNMKKLSLNDTNDLLRTLSSLKIDLLMQCGQQTGRSFRPIKYLQLVKMFMENYDKVTKNRVRSTPSRGGTVLDAKHEKDALSKAFLVRTFVGILNLFDKNQKVEVDYIPKRKRTKKSMRMREIKGHQLLEKPHSPQYTCPCGKKKIDDFVSCSLCKVTIHKMCEGLLTECKVAQASQDFPKSKFIKVPLEVLYKREENQVPSKLLDLLGYIEENGLNKEGIYRTNGSQMEKKRLIAALDSEEYAKEALDDFDVRTAADVVKVFFRSLPDPLFTYAAYQRFMMAMDPESEEEKVRLIFQHISKLPSAHFDTLHATVVHLLKVSDKSEHNKMTVSNMATVFAENLIFTDTVNIQAGAAILSTIQKKTHLLVLILERIAKRVNHSLSCIEDLDNALAVIDAKLSVIQGEDDESEDAENGKRNLSMVLDLQLSKDVENHLNPEEMRLKSGTIPFSQADQNILKEQQSNDTNVPRDEFLAPVHHSDASVLMEQRKLTIKIRERLLNNMTALTYDGADAMRNMGDDDEDGGYFVHSCSDKTQSLMIVEPRNPKYRTTTDTSHLEPTTDSETNERGRHNSRSDGSVSDSSDIADEYSYKLSWRLTESCEPSASITGSFSNRPFPKIHTSHRDYPDADSNPGSNPTEGESNLDFIPNMLYNQLFHTQSPESDRSAQSASSRSSFQI